MAKAGHFAALKTSLWCLGLSFTREEAKVCSGARRLGGCETPRRSVEKIGQSAVPQVRILDLDA